MPTPSPLNSPITSIQEALQSLQSQSGYLPKKAKTLSAEQQLSNQIKLFHALDNTDEKESARLLEMGTDPCFLYYEHTNRYDRSKHQLILNAQNIDQAETFFYQFLTQNFQCYLSKEYFTDSFYLKGSLSIAANARSSQLLKLLLAYGASLEQEKHLIAHLEPAAQRAWEKFSLNKDQIEQQVLSQPGFVKKDHPSAPFPPHPASCANVLHSVISSMGNHSNGQYKSLLAKELSVFFWNASSTEDKRYFLGTVTPFPQVGSASHISEEALHLVLDFIFSKESAHLFPSPVDFQFFLMDILYPSQKDSIIDKIANLALQHQENPSSAPHPNVRLDNIPSFSDALAIYALRQDSSTLLQKALTLRQNQEQPLILNLYPKQLQHIHHKQLPEALLEPTPGKDPLYYRKPAPHATAPNSLFQHIQQSLMSTPFESLTPQDYPKLLLSDASQIIAKVHLANLAVALGATHCYSMLLKNPAILQEATQDKMGTSFLAKVDVPDLLHLKKLGYPMDVIVDATTLQNPLHMHICQESKSSLEALAKLNPSWIAQRDVYGHTPLQIYAANHSARTPSDAYHKLSALLEGFLIKKSILQKRTSKASSRRL